MNRVLQSSFQSPLVRSVAQEKELPADFYTSPSFQQTMAPPHSVVTLPCRCVNAITPIVRSVEMPPSVLSTDGADVHHSNASQTFRFEVPQQGLCTSLTLTMRHFHLLSLNIPLGEERMEVNAFSSSQLPLHAAQFVRCIRLVTQSGREVESLFPEAIAACLLNSSLSPDAKEAYLAGFSGIMRNRSAVVQNTTSGVLDHLISAATGFGGIHCEEGLSGEPRHGKWIGVYPEISTFGMSSNTDSDPISPATDFSVCLPFSCFSHFTQCYDTRTTEKLFVEVQTRYHFGSRTDDAVAEVTYSMHGRFMEFHPSTTQQIRSMQVHSNTVKRMGTTWISLDAEAVGIPPEYPSGSPERDPGDINFTHEKSFGAGVRFELSKIMGVVKRLAVFAGSGGPSARNFTDIPIFTTGAIPFNPTTDPLNLATSALSTTWACQSDVSIKEMVIRLGEGSILFTSKIGVDNGTADSMGSLFHNDAHRDTMGLNERARRPHPSLRVLDFTHFSNGSVYGGGLSFHLMTERVYLDVRPNAMFQFRYGFTDGEGEDMFEDVTGHFYPCGSRVFAEVYVQREIDVATGRILNVITV